MNFNKKDLLITLDRAAATYDEAAVLQREIAQRLLEHLDPIRIEPKIILDLGAKTGFTTQLLKNRFPKSNVIALEISEKMLQKNKRSRGWFSNQTCICSELENLPLTSGSIDLIFSNLTLHWCNDLTKTFQEMERVLRPEGLLLFSTFGPDTLKELRESWQKVDDGIHVHNFIDMHDVGDALLHSKFSDPVMEMEYLTMTYPNIHKLLKDLKLTGYHNLATNREKNLTGKNKFEQFIKNYENLRQENQVIPATFEIIYGHAWKPQRQAHAQLNEMGEAIVSVSDIKVIKNKAE